MGRDYRKIKRGTENMVEQYTGGFDAIIYYDIVF